VPVVFGMLLLSAILIQRALRQPEPGGLFRECSTPSASSPEDSVQARVQDSSKVHTPEALGRRLEPVATEQQRSHFQDTTRARYPKTWEVPVPAGSRLDSVRRALNREIAVLPARDLEDQSALPIWFRVYLRKKNPALPTSGPYQYPRTAGALLRWMLSHPDSVK